MLSTLFSIFISSTYNIYLTNEFIEPDKICFYENVTLINTKEKVTQISDWKGSTILEYSGHLSKEESLSYLFKICDKVKIVE